VDPKAKPIVPSAVVDAGAPVVEPPVLPTANPAASVVVAWVVLVVLVVVARVEHVPRFLVHWHPAFLHLLDAL
jgi:hypothetical protein